MAYDWTNSRLIQFNNSKTLNTLLDGVNDRVGIGVKELAENLIDVDIAEGSQLDVIGRLVGANRELKLNISIEDEDFGFDDNSWYGFDVNGGTFDIKLKKSNLLLNDNAFRTYIKMKSYSNVNTCSLGAINNILNHIFAGRGVCYAEQTGVTEMTYTFNFLLDLYEKNLIINRHIPVPAGYALIMVQNI